MIHIVEVEGQKPQSKFGPPLSADRPVERWLELRFAWDREVLAKVRAIPGAMWLMDKKCWLVPAAARAQVEAIK